MRACLSVLLGCTEQTPVPVFELVSVIFDFPEQMLARHGAPAVAAVRDAQASDDVRNS